MESKKVLVVFYSRTGTTKKVSEMIASKLECNIEEIIDTKNRKGAIGYMMAGKDATLKRLTKIELIQNDPSEYHLIIIGTPVWAWTMSSPIRTYITENKEKFKNVRIFLTCGAAGNRKVFTEIEELIGIKSQDLMELTTKEVAKGEYEKKVNEFIK